MDFLALSQIAYYLSRTIKYTSSFTFIKNFQFDRLEECQKPSSRSSQLKKFKQAEKAYYQKKLKLDRQLLQLNKQEHSDRIDIETQKLQLKQTELEFQAELSASRFQLLRKFQHENVNQKWQEILLDWDSKQNWFSKINRYESEKILSKYADSLLILTSLPEIAKDCDVDIFRNLDFGLEMRNLDDFLEKNYSYAEVSHPVKHYSDYFKEAIGRIEIEQLHDLLNKIAVYIIFPDITTKKIKFRIAHWSINGDLIFFPEPIEWNWQQNKSEMIAQGKSELESVLQIRDLFVEIYKIITVLLSDSYYLSIDPLYQVQFTSLCSKLAFNLPTELYNQFNDLEQQQKQKYLDYLHTINGGYMNKVSNKEKLFSIKKKELLKLLDKAQKISDTLSGEKGFSSVSSEIRNKIQEVRQNCEAGLFSIALIAAFQSGKTTSFNAFADGREIAPRGLGGGGVKTSACLVKVRNPNQKEEEGVKVIWRDYLDLLRRLDEALKDSALRISEELNEKIKQITTSENAEEAKKHYQDYYSLIDFQTSESEGYALLKQALIKELKEYQKSQNKGSEKAREKLDLLRFAMIVLAYYNDSFLNELQNKDNFTPEEIQNYIKFPDNFEERWNKCFNNLDNPVEGVRQEFALQEVMYPFIKEVTYVINSENIRKSGAQIVDCPGLFASSYDTNTALRAMYEASAIWFLTTGDTQLSQPELDILSAIDEAGYKEKVLFGNNYKDNPESESKKQVWNTISAQLKALDYNASYQLKPLVFNAFLALRAMQGEKLLDDSLDEFTQQQIIEDAEAMCEEENYDSVKKAWLDSVIAVMSKVSGSKELKKLFSLKFNTETVKLIREKSQWNSATHQIKEYVFKTKAWSVLVESGCEPINQTLKSAEDSLKQAETDAHKSFDEAQRKWNEAKEKLALFEKESNELLESYIDQYWERVLAENFWKEVYRPSIEETGKLAAPLIADEATISNATTETLKKIGNVIANNAIKSINWFLSKIDVKEIEIDANLFQTLRDKCAIIIRNKFEYSINIKSEGWFNSLRKGGNEDYEKFVLTKVNRATKQIKQKWKDLELDNNSYLEGLWVNLPEFSGDIRRDMEKYNKDGIDSAVDRSIEKPFNDMGIFFSTFYFLFLFDLVFPGLGTAAFTVVVVATVVYFRYLSKKDYIEEISNKITEELNKGVGSKQSEVMKSLTEKLIVVREFYSGKIQQSFKLIEDELDKRIKDSKVILASKQEEREEIAKIAKNFRTNEIEPLQRDMEQFRSSVEEIWEKPS